MPELDYQRAINMPRMQIFIVSLHALLLGLLMHNASAISFDRNVVLYANEESEAPSVQMGTDGTLFLTLQRARPTVVKLDRAGKVVWAFEGDREDGIDKNFQTSVLQSDGTLVVCGSRDPLPGLPSQHYPGFFFKLDSYGKEVSRYDPMPWPQAAWPFWSALICAKWGNDFLFVANPPFSKKYPEFRAGTDDLAQKIVMRVSSHLSPVWTRTSPAYHATRAMRPSARTFEFSNGNILIVDVDRAVLLTTAGDTAKLQRFDHCLMLGVRRDDSNVRLLCRVDTANTRWEVLTLDRDLKTVGTVSLDAAASGYNFISGQLLPNGMIAIVGPDQNQQGDIVVFDATGAHAGAFHFPKGDRILFVQPTDDGIVVVTQSYTTNVGNTVVTWLKAT